MKGDGLQGDSYTMGGLTWLTRRDSDQRDSLDDSHFLPSSFLPFFLSSFLSSSLSSCVFASHPLLPWIIQTRHVALSMESSRGQAHRHSFPRFLSPYRLTDLSKHPFLAQKPWFPLLLWHQKIVFGGPSQLAQSAGLVRTRRVPNRSTLRLRDSMPLRPRLWPCDVPRNDPLWTPSARMIDWEAREAWRCPKEETIRLPRMAQTRLGLVRS